MSGKDQSVVSKEALMSTKPGKQILKQGLFKKKGFKLFNQYKEEAENEFPNFAQRFTDDLLREIKADSSPNSTQQKFADEVGSSEIILQDSQIPSIKEKLEALMKEYGVDLEVNHWMDQLEIEFVLEDEEYRHSFNYFDIEV